MEPEDEVSFIPMEAVSEKDGVVELRTALYGNVSTGYTRFAENDLLWAKITPCMQNGKATVAHNLIKKVGFGSTEFHVLRPLNEEVLPEYLFSILTTDDFLTVAQAAFSGSAGQQRVPDTFLKTLPLPLPPRAIQQELVAKIDAARARRAELLRQADEELAKIDVYVSEIIGIE